MPHIRKRLALEKLRKKLKFFPVVAVQGARQTGKSFLVRDLLKQHLQLLKYVSFDLPSTKQAAIQQPHTFLLENSQGHSPLAIDEAQKVPDIFDAIKFEVDQERIPGRYLLLGSTEFSHFSKVRESLTGRLGRIRLYPLNLRETLGAEKEIELNRKHIVDYLSNGGMPGIFYIRNREEQDSLIQDLLDLICHRDIHQFKTLKLDSDLCFEILKLSATLKEPSKSEISKSLKVDSRKIETHLKALCELFVLQKLNPHPSGGGKAIYLLFDVGVARYLGADLNRRLHIFILNERLTLNEYSLEKRKSFYYYRSTGMKMIHLVEEDLDGRSTAFQVLDCEKIKKTDAELMKSFLLKNKSARNQVLAPILEKMSINGVHFVPWEDFNTYKK